MAGPFASAAHYLAAHGLAVIPCPGDDGKSPRGAVRGYHKWQSKPGPDAIEKFAKEHGDANIGIITSLSGLTIVDVDGGDELANEMLDRCGDTPLVTRTPSGGRHFWYRSGGERNANLRSAGLNVDVRGIGAGLIIAPPSVRPSTGIAYVFERGDLDALQDLPKPKPASLKTQANGVDATAIRPEVGERNDFMFRYALKQARCCDNFEALLDVMNTRNSELNAPIPDSELMKTVASAWAYECDGRNWIGGEAHAVLIRSEHSALSQHKNGADALFLLSLLRMEHGARCARGESFAIASKAMAKANCIPGWRPRRYLNARRVLCEIGLLVCVHQGGKGPGDPSSFLLRQ